MAETGKRLMAHERIDSTVSSCQWEFTVDTRMMDLNRNLRADWLLGINQQAGEYLFKCAGLDNEYLESLGISVVYTRISVRFERPIQLGEALTVKTALTCIRGALMKRDLNVYSADGERAAGVFTEAIAMDIESRSMLKNDKCKVFEGVEAPACEVAKRVSHVRLPENMTEIGTHTIMYGDIDFNGHMNNTRYITVLLGFIEGGMKGKWLRCADMEYRCECRANETLTVLYGTGENGEAIYSLCGSTGEEKFRARLDVVGV